MKYKIIILASIVCFNNLAQCAFLKTLIESIFYSKDSQENKKWFEAVQKANLEEIQALIGKIDVNSQDKKGYTALMYASRDCKGDIVKLLLGVPGIDVNIQNHNGYTAIGVASSSSNAYILKLLLQAPTVDLHAALALKFNSFKMVKLIKDRISELTDKAFELISASSKTTENDIAIFKSITAQIGFNVTDKYGDTFLHKAIKEKNLEIVKLVLYADPTCLEINNKEAKDPIELAIGYPECFELFMNLTGATTPLIRPSVEVQEKLPSSAKVAPNKSEQLSKAKLCANCAKKCDNRCSRCKKMYYCSVDCQKVHWKIHKQFCKN